MASHSVIAKHADFVRMRKKSAMPGCKFSARLACAVEVVSSGYSECHFLDTCKGTGILFSMGPEPAVQLCDHRVLLKALNSAAQGPNGHSLVPKTWSPHLALIRAAGGVQCEASSDPSQGTSWALKLIVAP